MYICTYKTYIIKNMEHECTRGNCVFYRNESDINSYCPDYHSRKRGDKKQTLEDFCKEEGTEYIIYRELY